MVLHRKVLSFFILKTFVEHCNLRNNHSVFTVNFSFLHSWWKNSLGQWDFGNQSWIKWHFYKFIWCILELQSIKTSVRNTLFLLLCVKRKIQPTLIITSEKPAVLNVFSMVIFFCQVTYTVWVFQNSLMSRVLYFWLKSFYKNIFLQYNALKKDWWNMIYLSGRSLLWTRMGALLENIFVTADVCASFDKKFKSF